MKDIIDVLRQVAELKHWTRHPITEASGEQLSYPPIVTWRYEQPSDDLADFFRMVVTSYSGTVAWDFLVTGSNWCLMPCRIREYAEEHGLAGQAQAQRELKKAEPELGIRANAELSLLAEHIQRHIEGHVQRR